MWYKKGDPLFYGHVFFNISLFVCFRIQIADPEYKKAFDDELVAFKERIRRRALEKIEEQMEEARQEEELERQSRLGPGGLDPVEVFETLPDVTKTNHDYFKLFLFFIWILDPYFFRY
jgi:hypothetical protein